MFELIIDNQIADILPGEAMSLSYAISDVENVDKSKDNTSKTIRLPGTNKNRRIFKFADDINVIWYLGQQQDFTGVIRIDGTTVMIGKVKLTNVTGEYDGTWLEIVIIGNSRPWVDQMKEADLNGISIGGQHIMNQVTQAASETNNYIYSYGLANFGYTGGEVKVERVEDSGGYCKFFLETPVNVLGYGNLITNGEIIYGAGFTVRAYNVQHRVTSVATWWIVTDVPFQESDTGYLREVKGKTWCEDRPLYLNAWNILTKLFLSYGYQISSTFLNTAFFKSLYIDPANFRHSEEYAQSHYCKIGMTAVQEETLGDPTVAFKIKLDRSIQDAGGHFDTQDLYEYVSLYNHLIKFKTGVKIKASAEVSATLTLMIYGVGSYAMYVRDVPVDLSEDYKTFSIETDYRLAPSESVQVWVTLSISFEGIVTVSPDETIFEAEVDRRIVKGYTVVPGNYLPTCNQLDLVRGIKHAFNLNFYTDIDKRVIYIEPRDSFYGDTVLDWSDKLDKGEVVLEELGSALSKTLSFKLKEDSNDEGVKAWNVANKKTLGESLVTVTNKFANDGKTEYINPVFSPTLMDTFDCIGLKTVLCPKIWGKDDELSPPQRIDEYSPRLLYMNGVQSANGDSWTFEDTERYDFPQFSSWTDDEASEKSLLFEDNAGGRGLFERFYFNWLKTINESRKLTGYFDLKPSDVAGFAVPNELGDDFRALIRARVGMSAGEYRVNAIKDYQPGKLAKVELIKNVDRTYTLPVTNTYEAIITNNTRTLGQEYANGFIYHHAYDWYVCRNAAAGSGIGDGQTRGIGALWFNQYAIERTFLFFYINLPAGATVLSTSLFLYKISGSGNEEPQCVKGLQNKKITTADYDAFDSIPLMFYTLINGNWRELVFNEYGKSLVSTNGWLKLCLRGLVFDYNNLAPGSNYDTFKTYFNNAPAGMVNYLKIKYK